MAGKRGAPKGNTNGATSADVRPWRSALNRAIAQDNAKRVRQAAEQLLDLAANGEQWAVKELADRLDGKAVQQVIGAGEEGEHKVTQRIEVAIIDHQIPSPA